jgi:hypothetical protein
VLPGKFSFFPTVAYQTYLRIEELLHLEETVDHPPYCANPKREQLAKSLVAASYPVQILTAELNRETDLATGICDDLSAIAFPCRSQPTIARDTLTGR